MNRTICMQYAKRLALGLAALALTATPSFAQTYDLCASDGTVSIGGEVIPIWGYADITGGGSCTTGLATLPGPELSAADGATLTINLSNALSVPVSIFIPGLAKDAGDALSPQATPDVQGRERLTSFDKVVAPTGTVSFSWAASEGTYLYYSGADVRTQVPMGLYGALVVTGAGYPAVAAEQVLVFSEIDPALNNNPGSFGGARVSNWSPQYFLINGVAYDPANPPIAINLSEDTLLRFVNAGLETFVPTLDGGLYMDVIAEDGNLYPYPLRQYGLELQAGKTYDAVINAGSAGTYALYDRALHLANGGMIAKIEAAAAVGAPTANADSYSMDEEGVLTADGLVSNPEGVLFNDALGDGAGPLTASLVSDVSSGVLALAADGTFTYTPTADFYGVDTFSYLANDGLSDSNVAVVTITVNGLPDAPVANPDAYDAAEGATLNVAAPGVLENDSDADGDSLAVTTTPVVAPSKGALTLYADGSFDYTPSVAAPDSDTFTYEVCDATPLCSQAVVTLSIIAVPNVAPIANNDTTSITRGTTLVDYSVVANDTDADGTIDAATVDLDPGTGGLQNSVSTQRGGQATVNASGQVTYTPPRASFRGTDTFQYTVNDNDGATSNVATVSINVVR
jgi:FtsP/CotA-like multicopper oxidase with cupredoxin domain